MIDITLQNFEAELIHASQQCPVLLDIWAPWCGPCRTLGPILEKLETTYAGRFKLAKLNSDEVPEIATQLSQMFGVRSIPFCVMFVDGQPVDGFVGALPEAQIREFLDKHVPPGEQLEAEADLADAQDLLADGDLEAALGKLAHAVETDPGNDTARFDYVKALLELGLVQDARAAFAPVATKAADTLTPSPRLAALAIWLAAFEAGGDPAALQESIAANKRDFDARFALAQHHLAQQRFTEAMDELLEIIMRDKAWNGEAARKAYVAILELLTKPAPKPAAEAKSGTLELAGKAAIVQTDPLIDQYRRKLSMALF
ncbi:tetratricopeptide repeat protein [Roseateles sp.]|uniref:tetratricopeptide repeat protein n=1 Tax=Roseateles sp. TaxID=1971397 RepID=UPI0039E7E522